MTAAEDRKLLARAVCDAVFSALLCAERDGDDRWFAYADRIERKFIGQYGRHPAAFAYGEANAH